MKNLIIILGTIMLGVFIFNLMVGDGSDSLKSTIREVMVNNISTYTN